MVRSVSQEIQVHGYSAQALFDLAYGDDTTFIRGFHREVNACDVTVSPWVGGQRTVVFTTPVDAPAFIKRLVGKDVMTVEEAQLREKLPGGGWRLTSRPVPDMPGGARFVTEAVFTFTDAAAGGCQVDAAVTCSASGPYGLAGTIEAFMADSAGKSLKDFLDFLHKFAEAPAAAAPAAAPAPAAAAAAAAAAEAPAAAAAALAARGAEPAEQFYDALELPLPPLPAVPGPAVVPSGDGLRFEDAALLYLRYMCRTGDQTVGLLQALELHVRSLQEKVAALQAAEEERRRRRRWLPEIPDTVSARQAVLGAALLASGAAAGALLFARRQQAAAGRGA
ncbi:hypothetical protein ABPG75_004226 [Micractinium tetrahymenae]